MDAETQHALIRRIHAHLTARTTDVDPAGPTRLPVDRYGDPARHARELATLFRQQPLVVGHVSQIPTPGDFFTHDAAGIPLLIVRTDDGRVAAHLNVCRHRGTRLTSAPCGHAKAFVCPYHAWSYARDGKLLGVPHEAQGFAGLRLDLDLTPAPVTVHAGLICVTPPGVPPSAELALIRSVAGTPAAATDVAPAPAAAEGLAVIARELVGFGVDTAHVYAPRSVTANVSWRLAIDVFLETYHLRTAHKDTIYRLFFDTVGLVDKVGPHLRTVFPKRTVRDLGEPPDATWELRRHANVLYHLFPNTLILVQPDHASVFHAYPLSPTTTRVDSYTLVPEPAVSEKAQRYWDANNAILYEAVGEDLALGESIQAGIGSGANTHVTFGAFEHALAHFHAQADALSE